MNNRIIILLTIFFVSTFFFQIIFVEDSDGYLYTELQESHMQEEKYKRDDNFWMVRKTEEPLNVLVYDYAENGKRIEFGYLINGYQDGLKLNKDKSLSLMDKLVDGTISRGQAAREVRQIIRRKAEQ